MNLPYFIAQRIRKPAKATFSATVSRIGLLSIALGLAVGIVSLSVLVGFQQTIKEKIFLLGAHLKVNKVSLNQSIEETAISKKTVLRALPKNSGIRHIQAIAHKAAILKTPDELSGVIVKGVGADFDWKNFNENLIAGSAIAFGDSSYSNQIVISNIIAKKLRLSVGSSVLVYLVQYPPKVRKLKVVGIYETFVQEFDNQLIISDLSLVQNLNEWPADSVGSVEVYLDDVNKINEAAQTINSQLPTNLRVSRITDRFPSLFDWLQMLDRNAIIFLGLILFVACFNVIAVLLVMIVERTNMIGLLKTLGSPNSQIRKMFFYVGLRLSVLGIVLGNVVGLGLCWVQSHFKLIGLDPTNYYMNYVPIYFDWWAFLWLNIGTLLVIALVLMLPTIIVGRISPIEALKSKK